MSVAIVDDAHERYIVLIMGFYYAPSRGQGDVDTMPMVLSLSSGVWDAAEAVPGWTAGLTKLWA